MAVLKRHLHRLDQGQKEMMMAWSGCFQKRQKVPGLYELANRICSPRVSVFLELLRSVHEAVAIEEQLKTDYYESSIKERKLKDRLNIYRDLMFSPG